MHAYTPLRRANLVWSHVTVSKRHPDSLYPGGGSAYWTHWRMWELLDDRGKDEASAAMKVARAAMNIESGEGKDVVK